MRSSSVLSVASAALLAAGCSGSSSGTPGPVVTSVEPATGFSSAPVPVTIRGRNFALVAVQPSGGGDPVVKVPRVLLGTVELTPVKWVDSSTLTTTVPQGLATGPYAVTVIDGHGASSVALAAAYTVLTEGQLSASVSADRATVNVGQSFTVTLTLTNNGGTDVTELAFGDPTVTGSAGGAATLSGPAPTAPARLAAGAQTTATWTFTTTAVGRVAVSIGATGKASGNALTAVPPAPATVIIQTPASLTATWTARALQTTGQPVTVTLVLTNAAGAATANVTAVTPTSNPAASCAAVTPAASEAAPVSIAGGTFGSFSWDCTATVVTQTNFTFSATVAALDTNSGLAVPVVLNGVQVRYTPNPTLGVTVAGNAGVGSTVSSSPPGILNCSTTGGTGCSAQFAAGRQVTLTAAPRAGATVAWTGPGGINPCAASSPANSCLVTISGTENNDVTATFTLAQFNVAVLPASASGGTGSVTSNLPTGATTPPVNVCAVDAASAVTGTCAGVFDFGTTVVLTAAPGNAGTAVDWTTGCDAAAGGVVDAAAHTCTFANIQAAKSVTATFTLGVVALTVTPPTNGSIRCGGAACGTSFPFGTPITLTAVPAAGFAFGAWTGDCAGQSTATCALTMDGAKTVGATFTGSPQPLTVASNPAAINAAFSCNGVPCAATYPTGTSLTITATAPGYNFSAFSGACTGATCTFTMPANGATVTAAFTPANQTLTLGSSPTGINAAFTCNGVACNASYPTGTALTIAATAPGYNLTGFSGACTGATCTFSMPAAGATVTANFAAALQPFSVAADPSGAAAFTCNGVACAPSYPTGTAVTITPAVNTGFAFSSWSGCTGNATGCTLTITPGGNTVTATFLITVTVTFEVGSSQGNVTSSAGSINCNVTGNPGTCEASFAPGSSVTLTANPLGPSIGVLWSGACAAAGTQLTCDLNNIQAPATATALFN